MAAPTIKSTVAALIAPSKGILAADESFPTIEKRFNALHLSSNEENRRAYGEVLFTTAGLKEKQAQTLSRPGVRCGEMK